MKATVSALIISTLLLGATANAINYAQYKKLEASKGPDWETTKIYLIGVSDGLQTLNYAVKSDKKVPYFCPPEHLPLNPDNVIQMVDKYTDSYFPKTKESETMDMGIVLFFALQNTFPCKG